MHSNAILPLDRSINALIDFAQCRGKLQKGLLSSTDAENNLYALISANVPQYKPRIKKYLEKNPSEASKVMSLEMKKTSSIFAGFSAIDSITLTLPPIHLAVYWENLAALEILIDENKIDINTKSENGFTPLMLAIIMGNTKTVRYLIEKGANLNIILNTDLGEVTALGLAIYVFKKEMMKEGSGKYIEIIQTLLSYGAGIGAKLVSEIPMQISIKNAITIGLKQKESTISALISTFTQLISPFNRLAGSINTLEQFEEAKNNNQLSSSSLSHVKIRCEEILQHEPHNTEIENLLSLCGDFNLNSSNQLFSNAAPG